MTMEIAERKGKRKKREIHLFHPLSRASRIRGTRRLNPELGVAVWRRVDVSLYACRKRCPGAEARETRGRHGRRVERITNMTSILRQAGGEAITVGGVRPPPSPASRLASALAILALHTRTLNFDFVGIKAGNVSQVGRQAGGHVSYMFYVVLTGVL